MTATLLSSAYLAWPRWALAAALTAAGLAAAAATIAYLVERAPARRTVWPQPT